MKKVIFQILILLVSTPLFGQKKVEGIVKDNSGDPVIGAAVIIPGVSGGVVTDLDGRFLLTIPSDNGKPLTLEISCMGYKTATIPVTGSAPLQVILEEDAVLLDEVVYVGYGSMRRSDLTGALSSVRIEEDKADISNSLDQLLQGAAAGVSIVNNSSAPGAGLSIRIRGVTSLNSSSEPLYVVDGMVMTEAVSGSVSSDMDEETNGLLGINPQDIAHIEILKDASATAIYGADGANGVVLITTKQAGKDRTSIRFSAGVDLSTPYKRIDMMPFDEYVDFLEARTDTYASNTLAKIYETPATREGLKVTTVNWQDYALRNVVNQRYHFSINGSQEGLKYNFSLGYKQQQGIVRATGLEQYTSLLNVEKKLSKNWTLGAKINFSHVYSVSQQGAGLDAVQASTSMMTAILTYRPFTTVSLEDDWGEDEDVENYSGPDRWIKYAKSTNRETRVTPALFTTVTFGKGFSFTSKLGGDFRASERTQWRGREVSRSTGAVGGVSDVIRYRWSWDNTLNYTRQFNKHYINGVVGLTYGQDKLDSQNPRATNVIQEELQVENINSAYNASFVYGETRNSRASAFARCVYSFADRYILTATYRLDGSSKFGGKNRFAGFPSAAFSWYASREPWFVVPVISMLKLRLGWGQVGNSNVTSYQTVDNYSAIRYGNHFNDAGYLSGVYRSNFSNENLKWETTRQLNAGIDFAMFKGRLSLTVDAYDKTTFDLLQSRKVPYLTGYSSQWVNQGSINNRGLEFSLEAVPVTTKNFEWMIGGNLSLNRNKIVDLGFSMDTNTLYLEAGLPSELRYYLGNNIAQSTYLRNPANIFIEGYPIGLFYGYKTDGIVQEGETGVPLEMNGEPRQPGQIRYVDLNGNGYIDEYDRTVIGDNNPKFTYGFKTSFRLYGFALSLDFDGVFGKQVLYANLAQTTDTGWMYCTNTLRSAYEDAWSTTNPGGAYPALNGGITQGERAFVSDRLIQNASYLRLSSANLTYTWSFPKTSKLFRRIQVGISGTNLLVLTHYPGWSPIVSSFGSSMTRIGVDIGAYPLARTYSMDVKFSF